MKSKVMILVFAVFLFNCTSYWYNGNSLSGVNIHGFPQQSLMNVFYPDGSEQELTISTTSVTIDKTQNEFFNQLFLNQRRNPFEIQYQVFDPAGSIIIQSRIKAIFYATIKSGSKEFNTYSWSFIDVKYQNINKNASNISLNNFSSKIEIPYILLEGNDINKTDITMRYARTHFSKVNQSGIKNIVDCILHDNQYIDFIDRDGKVLAEIREKGLLLFEGSESYTQEIIEFSTIIFTLRNWIPKMVDMLEYEEES